MTYAIVETSGTQLRVEPGRFYDVNRLPFDEDEAVTLDKVLYVAHDGNIMVGQPLVEGATISATVMRHLRGRKVIVYKMQPKKKTRKKRGHRQELTRIMIDAISLNEEVLSGEVALAPAQESQTEAAPVVAGEPDTEAAVVAEEPVTGAEATPESSADIAEAPTAVAEATDTETGAPEAISTATSEEE